MTEEDAKMHREVTKALFESLSTNPEKYKITIHIKEATITIEGVKSNAAN